MHVFSFNAWDVKEKPNDRYDTTENDVSVSVVADSEEDALTKVKTIINREKYVLNSVAELTDKHAAHTNY